MNKCRKRVLIYYLRFSDGIGGSEYLPLRLLEILSKKHDVTFLTENPVDWQWLNQRYNSKVNPNDFKTVLTKPQNFFVKILDVKLTISAVRKSQFPEDKKNELLLVGRSNVGKSSFINTLINRKNFARKAY